MQNITKLPCKCKLKLLRTEELKRPLHFQADRATGAAAARDDRAQPVHPLRARVELRGTEEEGNPGPRRPLQGRRLRIRGAQAPGVIPVSFSLISISTVVIVVVLILFN